MKALKNKVIFDVLYTLMKKGCNISRPNCGNLKTDSVAFDSKSYSEL